MLYYKQSNALEEDYTETAVFLLRTWKSRFNILRNEEAAAVMIIRRRNVTATPTRRCLPTL